ncbi:hypothetical protein [Prauserella rugosa]|uniref:DUF222 domain-containing protein n=1 Tax=Prauserella rugosa TaxID=43354 RepID=A0A660CA58_9PSEU|nr:hypothetical protein [Prauserella rugosa]KMS83486.1 hypothetical protein ACZ91_52860 [Streptomyces regensis]TWH19234.1 hypothetical protein JD82_01057 [Prauserella rugosa]
MSDTSEEVGEQSSRPVTAPPVTAAAMLAWLEEASEAVAEGRLEADELIALLGQLREAATACANASDWALLAAREAGASLRQIAPVFGKGYVRAPAARLEKLHREVLSADQFLELMRRRMRGDVEGADDIASANV